MTPTPEYVAAVIDAAPLNRGLRGAEWLASEGNIPVTFGNGDIMLFDGEGSAIYQAHVLFVSRGREAIRHVRAALRIMFVEHGAELIFGLVPDFRHDVKLLARWAGLKFAGRRQTSEGPCELYVLSDSMWKGAVQ